MSFHTSPSILRSSVAAAAAVTITSLILGSFGAYIGYMERNAPQTQTAQVATGTSFDTATRNG
ncbi:MAG TPA: hypothetical protein VKB41_11445 [Steroidobacteraceae bacterium]|nr:hypothetical protein [Steroidobacteraceae bacterium]